MMGHGNGTMKIVIETAHPGMEKLSDRCVSFLNEIKLFYRQQILDTTIPSNPKFDSDNCFEMLF